MEDSTHESTSHTALVILYNAAPAAALAALFITLTIELSFANRRNTSFIITENRRRKASWLCSAVLLVNALDAVLLCAQLHYHDWVSKMSNDRMFNDLSAVLVWSCISWSLDGLNEPYAVPYIAFWTVAGGSDIAVLALRGSEAFGQEPWTTSHVVAIIFRLTLTWAAIVCSAPWPSKSERSVDDEETQALLGSGDSDYPSRYGRIAPHASEDDEESRDAANNDDDTSDADSDEDEKEIKELQEKRLREQGGWVAYLAGFLTFMPYLLPYKDRRMQYWMLGMLICIAIERVLTLMIPRQLGAITEALGARGYSGRLPWFELLTWAFLQFPLATTCNLVKFLARTRISQFAYARLKAVAFSHVMNLSMEYHSMKSSGKLIKAIEQGTDLTSIVENVLLTVPTFIDLIIAAIYLGIAFDRFMGLIVLATMIGYIIVSFRKNAITSKMERVSSEKTRVESEVLYDSVTNWQTVAYHNRRAFEEDRFGTAVKATIKAQRSYYDWTDYSVFLQDAILDIGLLCAAVMACYRVVTGASPLSNFVFLVMYWASVREPMSMIAFTFHETAAHLINAEWLFQLLQTKATVTDKPGAQPLLITDGTVAFNEVQFAYNPERQIIKGLSFVAEPGKTIALVGETGGGKSTILKLLYRFYDVNAGSITIDGQDLRDITLDSLRESLGIVPQDPCVFDQTVLQNILYARPTATMEEVQAACRAAQIHDQILKFPDGYSTRIGERGVRLSGGELQRLAIARVILRKPSIVILDEATSAVDSATEVSVQKALRSLSHGRTVFVVAHRLSTIVKADQILMMEDGRIAERGSHAELLRNRGSYHRLWHMQTVVGDAYGDQNAEQEDHSNL